MRGLPVDTAFGIKSNSFEAGVLNLGNFVVDTSVF